MNVTLHKYHGAGNDFVLMDARHEARLRTEEIAFICHRRFGIGADGFMSLEKDPAGTEFYMRYFNADGREGTMCGNGGRCIALFAHHLGIGDEVKTFNSSDGIHTAEITGSDDQKGAVRLGMADIRGYEIGENYLFLDTGSPHYVEFVNDLDGVDVVGRGREIRHCEKFGPIGGTNVNFAQLLPDGSIRVRTFERGVEDETLACGTGATACAVATHLVCNPSKTDYHVRVEGGDLRVEFHRTGPDTFERIFLTGPAEKVFECDLNLCKFVR